MEHTYNPEKEPKWQRDGSPEREVLVIYEARVCLDVRRVSFWGFVHVQRIAFPGHSAVSP